MSNEPIGRVFAVRLALGLITSSALVPLSVASAEQPADSSAATAPPPVSADVGSYDMGLMLGAQLANDGLAATISRKELLRGIDAALAGATVSPSEKDAAQQFVRASRATLVARNSEQARKFLENNAHQSGVATLPSGLQYRVLAAGDANAPLPGPRDQITVRYRASLADGTEIDRSDRHPQAAVFRLNSVIPGWREALSAMRTGARWQVFVPPELGYGANSPPPIPPGSLLVYELELLRVEPPQVHSPGDAKPPAETPSPANNPKPAAPR